MRLRLGLAAKGTLLVLAVAAAPVVVTWLFIDDVAVTAQNVADGEAAPLEAALVRAEAAYREAVAARKQAFRLTAELVARRPAAAAACDGAASDLTELLEADPALLRVSVGGPAAPPREVSRAAPAGARPVPVELAVPERPGCRLAAIFAAPGALLEDLEALGATLKARRDRRHIRDVLPRSYGVGFLLVVGGFMALTAAVAIAVGRRTTRRIDRLATVARRVAGGDLDARVGPLGARDEISALGGAFDEMLAQLARSRAEIEYLQKIGAWQEVARRMAHEIKNPLTPILLAAQELHRKYAGDDAAYRRLLDECHGIVTEEIEGLRRVVDAFHGFARLPRVEPRPLDVAELLDEVAREESLELAPPTAADAPSRWMVLGDRYLLKRVLLNLVQNARNAGGARVRVSWRPEAGGVALVVDDDGPGVPAALREGLFDPYVTGTEGGTGLGLAIAKKTALDHGGRLDLAPGPGPLGGARFELWLPGPR